MRDFEDKKNYPKIHLENLKKRKKNQRKIDENRETDENLKH